MNIDVVSVIQSATSIAVAGQIIHYYFFRGEHKQWKKEVDSKIEQMESTIKKLERIDTNQQLGMQKIDKLIELFEAHSALDEKQFDKIGVKMDGMISEVIKTLGKLAEKK